jgi:hypothetical protein
MCGIDIQSRKHMANSKWYLLVDTTSNTALEYSQLPETWHDIPGMHSLTDSELATIGNWSFINRGYQFLTLDIARAFNVAGIDSVINIKKADVAAWIRTMRDPVLVASDVAATSDRWDTFDGVSKAKIVAFRKALRDVTEGDIFNVVWPVIPAELNFLKKIDFGITNQSDEFRQMFTLADPVITMEQKRIEQCLRLKEYRDSRKYAGTKVEVNGINHWFWNDEQTRTQYALLDGMARRNNLPLEFDIGPWKTMSGETVQMTVGLLYTIIDTGIMAEQELFRTTEVHRLALMSTLDPLSYDFTAAVPPTFEEMRYQSELFEE